MDATLREVTHLPLEELWDQYGDFGRRVTHMTRDEIRAIVSKRPVRFVEANVGDVLRWIDAADCFRYWKTVAPNIAGLGKFHLEDFPGEFAFTASGWEGRVAEPLIVLEKHH